MFTVLLITFSGIALGYLFRKITVMQYLSNTILWTIWLLLFFFGLQVGANEEIISSLNTLGLKALTIAFAGVLGSSVVGWIIFTFAFGGKAKNKRAKENGLSGRGAINIKGMLGGGVVVAFFVLGCICGLWSILPHILSTPNISMWILYFLMTQVGMSIGCDKRLKEIIMSLNPKLLLLPTGTIIGTLVFTAATPFIMDMEPTDSLAIGAGFGYYSLSSLLITQIKEPAIGIQAATVLGTIALMANIMREVITLLLAPLIYKVFGPFAPIMVAGATSMDSTLPVITAVCGKDMVFISILHGVLVDFSVPFLVMFFASM